jgi:hypothetical protein
MHRDSSNSIGMVHPSFYSPFNIKIFRYARFTVEFLDLRRAEILKVM